MKENLQQTLLMELKFLLLPLAVSPDSGLNGQLLRDVTGWKLKEGSENKLAQFVTAYKGLEDIIQHPPATLSDVLKALDTVDQLFSAVREISAEPVSAAEEVASELINALVINYLEVWHPALHDVLALLTIIHPPAEISLKRV